MGWTHQHTGMDPLWTIAPVWWTHPWLHLYTHTHTHKWTHSYSNGMDPSGSTLDTHTHTYTSGPTLIPMGCIPVDPLWTLSLTHTHAHTSGPTPNTPWIRPFLNINANGNKQSNAGFRPHTNMSGPSLNTHPMGWTHPEHSSQWGGLTNTRVNPLWTLTPSWTSPPTLGESILNYTTYLGGSTLNIHLNGNTYPSGSTLDSHTHTTGPTPNTPWGGPILNIHSNGNTHPNGLDPPWTPPTHKHEWTHSEHSPHGAEPS